MWPHAEHRVYPSVDRCSNAMTSVATKIDGTVQAKSVRWTATREMIVMDRVGAICGSRAF
ncbi:MAG: hypothetical protein DHS20C16_21550 [Phycisphaerae bacterium]|nr:MAG: hypothetical protein DHS20C16_21550 [Phycisphaerae bacterium]